jgi:glycine dehydrogenase subunit 2
MSAEPTIFERSRAGRGSARIALPQTRDGLDAIPESLRRASKPMLPEVTEPELVRHYVRLSQRNHCIDTGFYPLGSCTMKYNPKINEVVAALPGFARLHPLQDTADAQGTLEVLYRLQLALSELSGLGAVSLQPAAGAHGEFSGLLIMRAWHEHRVATGRAETMPTHVVIPDTAHGTNPASVTMAGFKTLSVRTDERGGMDVEDLRAKVAEHSIVGLMLTNPSTLGLFDESIEEIARIIHLAGGLLYYDGANLNAIMGKARPGDMGFDIVHFNTHKSFSTPHGGGGPGAGPIAVNQKLAEFLPTPKVVRTADGTFDLEEVGEHSVGSIKHLWGNVGVLVRAYTYIRFHGRDGLVRASELAVLNANYLLARIARAFPALYGRICMHEFVISAAELKKQYNVRALDVAKRLIDYGYHPPTIYFPMLIEESMMVEPTETESRETLDAFAEALLAIVDEAKTNSDIVREAPHVSPVRRIDEARAVRDLVIRHPHTEPVESAEPVAQPAPVQRPSMVQVEGLVEPQLEDAPA